VGGGELQLRGERLVQTRYLPRLAQVGTPLTHRHFLRRAYGSYGPGIKAGEGTFPGPKTPIPGDGRRRCLDAAIASPWPVAHAW